MLLKVLLLTVLATLASPAHAGREECFDPERIAKLEERLAPFKWLKEPERKPAVNGTDFPFLRSLIREDLVCIAIAVDASGNATEALVFHPRKAKMSREDRNALLGLKLVPALDGGVAVPSIMITTGTTRGD